MPSKSRMIWGGLLLLLMVLANSAFSATTFTVSSWEDSGPGTLREAIAASNTTTGVTINFAVSNSITVYSSLTITAAVVIDGQGTTVGSTGLSVFMLSTSSSGSVLQGLAVVSAKSTGSSGIYIASNNNTVAACALGTDWSNTAGRGNYYGIYVLGSNNLIGGDRTLGQGNIISGNLNYGLQLEGSGNGIAGNVIGLNSSQTAALANYRGINLGVCTGNYIGIPLPGWGNVIAGNTNAGIYFLSSNANKNFVQNNYVGLSEGNQRFSNGSYGIALYYGTGNLVGGSASASAYQRNVISGNGTAEIWIDWNSNTIAGNFIGTDINGTTVVPGAAAKIYIPNGYSYNLIGLKTPGYGNLIAGGTYGVSLGSSSDDYNGIYGNTICSFTGAGIYLAAGANNDKAAPVISSAYYDMSTIVGSAGASDYVEVFKAENRPGLNGGSLQWVGSTTADALGQWNLPIGSLALGDYVCATASDNNNNTSAFSLNVLVQIKPTPTVTPSITPTSTISPTRTITPTRTATPTITPTLNLDLHGHEIMAWPNPGRNTIYFGWKRDMPTEKIVVSIYNLAGERIAELENKQPGLTIAWDARDIAPGVYLYKAVITTGGRDEKLPAGKIAILK